MLTLDDARRLAAGWCEAWNRRDLDAIMAHYSEDVAFRSPGVVERWNLADGWLHGRTKLRDNFTLALQTAGLHLTPVEVLLGVLTLCVLYRRETGALVCEMMELNPEGLVYRVVATHGAVAVATRPVTVPVQVSIPPQVAAPPVVMRPDIREFAAEGDLPHTGEAIWAALTRPALIARYMPANDFAPVVGHRFSFRANPVGAWDGVVWCEVVEVVGQNRLTYRWLASSQQSTHDGISMATIVTWTLAQTDRGTILKLVHNGYHTPESAAAFQVMNPNWESMFATISLIAGDLER